MTTPLAAKIAREYGTPCAVIDMDKVERNIARIQKACDDAGVANRPHIKTHKNPTIAKMQIAAGDALGTGSDLHLRNGRVLVRLDGRTVGDPGVIAGLLDACDVALDLVHVDDGAGRAIFAGDL